MPFHIVYNIESVPKMQNSILGTLMSCKLFLLIQ